MGAGRSTHIALADAGPRVRDVMLLEPDTLPSSATVADARRAFESPRCKLLVVADGTRYLGAVSRESVDGAGDDEPLTAVAGPGVPTLAPEDPTSRALELEASRIPVVEGGELLGLVCLNRTRGAFCVTR